MERNHSIWAPHCHVIRKFRRHYMNLMCTTNACGDEQYYECYNIRCLYLNLIHTTMCVALSSTVVGSFLWKEKLHGVWPCLFHGLLFTFWRLLQIPSLLSSSKLLNMSITFSLLVVSLTYILAHFTMTSLNNGNNIHKPPLPFACINSWHCITRHADRWTEKKSQLLITLTSLCTVLHWGEWL